jgi:hypothetical protein
MNRIRRFAIALALSCAGILLAGAARAELAAWDQAKVTALAKDLETTSVALYDTFYKQPTPTVGSGQSRAYQRLKQEVRRIRSEARELGGALGKGEGQEATAPIYENLMQVVRDAREDARQVFTGADVADKASAVRSVLNQLGPYYDPDFQALQPATR